MQEFGEILREVRKQNKYSQKELGDILGIGQTTIANYEKGTRFPSPEILTNIADFFELSVDTLFGREPIKQNYPINVNPSQKQYFEKAQIKQIREMFLNYLLEEQESPLISAIGSIEFTNDRIIQFYEEVLKYIMFEVGLLWEKGQISVAKEHYFTAIASKIHAGISTKIMIDNTEEKKTTAICMSLASEPHTLGIRIVADYFTILGYNPYYIGANVPTDALIDLVINTKAQVIAISVTMDYHIDSLKNLVQVIRSSKPYLNAQRKGEPIIIVVGGQGINGQSAGSLEGVDIIANEFKSLKEGLQN